MSFPYSNSGWMQVHRSQSQERPLDGMACIFRHIGGVPVRARFDNKGAVAAQVLPGAERVLSDGFNRFRLRRRFGADFCNPASGNEKGSVENKADCTRRNMLALVPVIDDFGLFNKDLLMRRGSDRMHCRRGDTLEDLQA
jgi:transposase